MWIEIQTLDEWNVWDFKTKLKRWLIPYRWKSMPAFSWGPLFVEWGKK